MVASTTASVREMTVTMVFPLLRPRLAQAIFGRDAPEEAPCACVRPPDFFRPVLPPSV